LIIRYVLGILFLLTVNTSVWGAKPNAVHFTCDFLEKRGDAGWQVVDSRPYLAPIASDFQFSMGNFSYRLHSDTLDRKAIQLQSMVNCLGVPPRNYLDQKVVLAGASVFFDSVLVRGESCFRIRLTFDSLGHLKDSCGYRFGDSSFASDPSGKYDFYYVKESLGDYRWNQIRDAFEFDYKGIARVYGLTDQAKINYHISPCELADIGWDQRWENAVDLSRNNIFALFSPGVNRLYMPVVLSLRFQRNWGYAPALILEGVSSAPEFCDLYAKEALRKGKLPQLAALGVSRDFRAQDRQVSSMAAGSFLAYLIGTRGLAKVQDWYEASTDLSVSQVFQKTYGTPMTDIEKEWRGYLDTLTIPSGAYSSHIQRSQLYMQVDDMLLFAREGLKATADTAQFGTALANLSFSLGEYEQAASLFRYMIAHDSTKSPNAARVFLANMLLAQGKIAAADSLYEMAAASDTAESYACHKLARIALERGKPELAIEWCRKAASRNKLPANGVDIDLMLGDAFLMTRQVDSAGVHYQNAMDNAKLLSSGAGDNPLNYLRFGKAAIHLGSAKLAVDYLNMALFLEERIFYLGQIFLTLGQAHDLLGDRQAALDNYHKVLKYKTAYFDRMEAQKYLKQAYHN
jgi:tetratricopeptide (TPR) repeat protein